MHSHISHLFALIELAVARGITKLYIHVITDGRDTLPKSGAEFIKSLQDKLLYNGIGKIASISGRNWTMDRNQNWDRTEKAYKALLGTAPLQSQDVMEVVKNSYEKNISDEFIEPTTLVDEKGAPVGPMQDGDTIVFFNFREDRACQITKALTLDDFPGFSRGRKLNLLEFVSMTEYEDNLSTKVVFPPQKIINPLGKILSDNKKQQLRIAETEKYAHVTYFFNGGREEPFP